MASKKAVVKEKWCVEVSRDDGKTFHRSTMYGEYGSEEQAQRQIDSKLLAPFLIYRPCPVSRYARTGGA